jgi:hypothetical protein
MLEQTAYGLSHASLAGMLEFSGDGPFTSFINRAVQKTDSLGKAEHLRPYRATMGDVVRALDSAYPSSEKSAV